MKCCPFCGGDAYLSEWEKSKLVTENGTVCPEVWFIGCKDKCFMMRWTPLAHHGIKEDAIKIWETRHD